MTNAAVEERVALEDPVTFSPELRVDDLWARYWLRQVTVRLRREIWWLWRERGMTPDAHSALLPPFIDRAQAAVELTRYREDKQRFFQEDVTARYLTGLLNEQPPSDAQHAARGSFGWVLHSLDLDDASAFVLALSLAASFDNAIGSVVASCLNDPAKTQPSLALAQRLWDRPHRVLTIAQPEHPLFRYGLVQLANQSQSRLSPIGWEMPLVVPSLVANQLLFPEQPRPTVLPPLASEAGQLTEVGRMVASRLAVDRESGLRVAPIRGPRGSAHAEMVQAIAEASGRDVVQFPQNPIALEDDSYRDVLATLCWLCGLDGFLREDLVSLASDQKHRSPRDLLPSLSIPITVYLGVSERSQIPVLPDEYLTPIVDVSTFGFQDRVDHWMIALRPRAKDLDGAIAEASRRFRYGKEAISSIAQGLKSLSEPLTAEELFAACRAEQELGIGELAQQVTPRFAEERLILPDRQERQFRELIKAMQSLTEVHYGWGTAKVWNESGIAALFAGPPGTGKTMGAEILAIELDLPMYRIDLSQVVNKYIGETEKNLKRLFDAADTSDVILFFDEADSLFGRRTEVKDAHDRYANLEISYLLERMERFKGLAILATNRKKDLDEAFLRRLRFVIDFPLPGETQRREIWKQVIPDGVDASEADFGFLARQFQLAGGHIRSVVFNACLQSVNSSNNGEKRLTMERLIVAVKREYDKLNRSVSLDYFGPYREIVEQMESSDEPRET
jgi:hypothetical protein